MRILNLGDRTVNFYLLDLGTGWLLVDTGYEHQYEGFLKKLEKHGLVPGDIRVIFLTHAHDDHAGFLNALLEVTEAPVILSPLAADGLRRGQNSFHGGCTTRLAWLFCKIMELLGKGEHRFPPVQKRYDDRFVFTVSEKISEWEKLCDITIHPTPGHTLDSISFLTVDGRLFCGDAAMNNLPSLNKVTIWAEDRDAFCRSWEKMIRLNPSRIYPGHGKPFSVKDLKSNYPKARQMKRIPLQPTSRK